MIEYITSQEQANKLGIKNWKTYTGKKGSWYKDGKLVELGNRIKNSDGSYVQLNSDGSVTKLYNPKTGAFDKSVTDQDKVRMLRGDIYTGQKKDTLKEKSSDLEKDAKIALNSEIQKQLQQGKLNSAYKFQFTSEDDLGTARGDVYDKNGNIIAKNISNPSYYNNAVQVKGVAGNPTHRFTKQGNKWISTVYTDKQTVDDYHQAKDQYEKNLKTTAQLLRNDSFGLTKEDSEKQAEQILKENPNYVQDRAGVAPKAATAYAAAPAIVAGGLGAAEAGVLGWAANTIKNGAKYSLYHPIESFVAPQLLNKGIDFSVDYANKNLNTNISDQEKNTAKLISSFILNPNLMSVIRGKTAQFAPVITNKNNSFMNNYLFNAMTNGDNATVKTGNALFNFTRSLVPGYIGIQTSKAVDYLTDGKGIEGELVEKGVNPYLAKALDYSGNALIYGSTQQLGNRMLSKPANNINQLAEGATTAYGAINNVKTNIPGIFTINRPAINGHGKSYQQIFSLSPSQIEHQFYNKRMSSYALKENDLPGETLYYDTYSGNVPTVGSKVGGLNVIGSIARGQKGKSNNFAVDFANQILSKTNRFGQGQRAIVTEWHGSEQLPPTSQMINEGWSILQKQGNSYYPIKMKQRALPAILSGRDNFYNDGKYAFDANGNLKTLLKSPNGQVYEVSVDVGGVGTGGPGGWINNYGDSGQHPMLTTNIKQISKPSMVRQASNTGPRINTWQAIKSLISSKQRQTIQEQLKAFKGSYQDRTNGVLRRIEKANSQEHMDNAFKALQGLPQKHVERFLSHKFNKEKGVIPIIGYTRTKKK